MVSFSALQRAEIAEIPIPQHCGYQVGEVSVLFNEPKLLKLMKPMLRKCWYASFSALQRAEIAEIQFAQFCQITVRFVSVLFNEPKLLKSRRKTTRCVCWKRGFSALQRAEIAEINAVKSPRPRCRRFQCSSTSRNC